MKIGTFLTANSLMAAVLIVWGQYWLTTLQIRSDLGFDLDTVNIGLFLTYSPVLTAIVAISIASIAHIIQKPRSDAVHKSAYPFAVLTLFGAVTQVLQTVVLGAHKMATGGNFWEPAVGARSPFFIWLSIISVIVLVFFASVVSTYLALKHRTANDS